VSGAVLVVNAGSTSLKLATVDAGGEASPWPRLDAVGADVVAVGHRVVHGGPRSEPALLDEALLGELEALAALAPLHNAPALAAAEQA
jgi:acetate kinase